MYMASRWSWVARRIVVAVLTESLAGLALCAAEAKDTAQSKTQAKPAAAAVDQAGGSPASPCMIVKHKGTVARRLIFTALIGVPIAPGAKYDLVDGVTYHPEKVAFKGKELQKLQAEGVRVIILEKKYAPEDVERARKSCGEPQLQAQKQ